MFLKFMSNEKAKLLLGVMLPYYLANLATVFISSWSSAFTGQHVTNDFCDNSPYICDQYNSSYLMGSNSNMTLPESVFYQSGVMRWPLAYYLLLGVASAVFVALPYYLQQEHKDDQSEDSRSMDGQSTDVQPQDSELTGVQSQGSKPEGVQQDDSLTEITALIPKVSLFQHCKAPVCPTGLQSATFLMGVFGTLIAAAYDVLASSVGASNAVCPRFSSELVLCNVTFSGLNGAELNLTQNLAKQVSGDAVGYGLLSAVLSVVVTSIVAHFASIAIIAFLDRYWLTEDEDIEMSVHSGEGSYDTSTSSIDYSV